MTCTLKHRRACVLFPARQKRGSKLFQVFRMIGIAMAIAGCVSAAPPAQAMLPQNSIAELRSRFTHETDPVRKAKLLLPLGDAEFQDTPKDEDSESIGEPLALFRQ